jgi:AraC-like DNA-binding protein
MKESDVRPRQQRDDGRVSPVDRKISELDGTYYKLSEVSDLLHVSRTTLRRLLDNDSLTAPSMEMSMGKMSPTYLYTPEDIAELKVYLNSVVLPRHRGKKKS